MKTVVELGEHLNLVWARKPAKLDVLGLEQTLDDVLSSTVLSSEEKIAFCKETLDAYTRRGHFDLTEYSNAR